jgi:hypothetical protein
VLLPWILKPEVLSYLKNLTSCLSSYIHLTSIRMLLLRTLPTLFLARKVHDFCLRLIAFIRLTPT